MPNVVVIAGPNGAGKSTLAPALLRDTIKAAQQDKARQMTLLVRKADTYSTVTLDYHDGLRYPKLERIEGTEDRLSALLRPRTQVTKTRP